MRSTRTSFPSLRRCTPVVGLVLAMLLLAGCGSSGGESGSGSTVTAEAFGHIHALDVNPADGRLHVATHNGLFVHTPDGFERVGQEQHDMMAFAVAGPDRFLISGHPGPGSGGPVHLGLTESTDGGQSWKTLSLGGEVDFHALDATGDRVYGMDSQTERLLASTDDRQWRNLGELPAIDVAADPTTPERLLLTGGDGVLVELIGTESPKRVESAPPLVLLDWVSEKLLIGAGPRGEVYRSADGGRSWQEAGSLPGEPHALTATESRWYAATENGILVSEDAGKTWSEMTT